MRERDVKRLDILTREQRAHRLDGALTRDTATGAPVRLDRALDPGQHRLAR